MKAITRCITAGRTCILLLAMMAVQQLCVAQRDSVPQRDTLAIYNKLHKWSKKRKVTKLIYDAVFVDPAPRKYEKKPLSNKKQKKTDPNAKFAGKIIRNVTIEVYDPFGFSVNDTTQREINPFQEAGNRYHVKTRRRIIRNLLLFEPMDTVELIKITESERLLRSARYVNDARIYLQKVPGSRDSVDAVVKVHDKWTLDAIAVVSTTGGRFTLRDRNILGGGQLFEQTVRYNVNGTYQLNGRYNIANISKSYISSDVIYLYNPDLTQIGFSFDRPFYSPLARWAGGVAAYKSWNTFLHYASPGEIDKLSLDYYNTDIWLARSLDVSKRKSMRRLNNIILAARYADLHFQQRPSPLIDVNQIYMDQKLYIGSIGFSLAKYYKDQYIYRFGANEDIPEGLRVQILSGVITREQTGLRYYSGFELTYGEHVEKTGYFSAGLTYGTLFNKDVNNNAALVGSLTYFTDLLKGGRWYFRQFAYFKLVNGYNKRDFEQISLLNDEMYGMNSGTLRGTGKMVLNLETVMYTPYNLLGFRFAPLVLMGFGTMRSNDLGFFDDRIYQSYGVGILFRNENLLTNSFKLSYVFYPYLPDSGNKPIQRFNPVAGFSVRFNLFTVSKPAMITYM